MLTIFLVLVVIAVVFIVANNFSNKNKPTFTTTTTYSENKNIFKPTAETVMILRALLFLGRADGKLMPKEIEIMINCLISQQPEHKQSDRWYLGECIKELKAFNEAEYVQFVDALNTNSKKGLLSLLRSIFGTQTKNHPYEDRLLNDLQRAIAES